MSFKTQDVIRDLFGVETTPKINPLVSSIGLSAVKIANNNPKRMSILIMNLSAATIFVGFGTDVSSSKAIRLTANGGNVTLRYDIDLQLVTYEMWAIATAANSNIYVLENNILRSV